jgi:histidyl-tRNA synthetase
VRLRLDPLLARGLSYYTGPIFELRSDDFPGSLGGGGRYDQLISMFSKQDSPACGLSLGVERILVLMQERGSAPAITSAAPEVMVTQWSAALASLSLGVATTLRAAGLRVELYPDHQDKYKRQLQLANERAIGFVVVFSDKHLDEGGALRQIELKRMSTGEQHTFDYPGGVEQLVALVRGG